MVNGRLGMVGFLFCLVVELASPNNIGAQLQVNALYVLLETTALATASYVLPEVLLGGTLRESLTAAGKKAVNPEEDARVALRFPGEYRALFDVERLNGRAAMVGFTAAVLAETLRGGDVEYLRLLSAGGYEDLLGFKDALLANHASFVEDAYLFLLTGTTFFAMGQLVGVQRKSRSLGASVHTWTGALQFVACLYPVYLERVERAVPGWEWQWVALALAMANCLTVGPLMKYYKGPKVYGVLFQLGYDFVISFQGIQLIAWSNLPDSPDWMYWAVMPFWYWSVQKLLTSAKYIAALAPTAKVPAALGGFAERSRAQLVGIKPDAPTLAYTGLNTAAALFDNAWMALFTLKGAEGFWAFSNEFAPNDAELSLIKPAVGSLTVTVVVFLGTLAARRKIPENLAGGLNVVLGSVGPWLILFWHKLVAPEEAWFPQFQNYGWDSCSAVLARLSDHCTTY